MAAFLGLRHDGNGAVPADLQQQWRAVLAQHVPAEHIGIVRADGLLVVFDARDVTRAGHDGAGCLIFGDLIAPGSQSAADDAALLTGALADGRDALHRLLAASRGNFAAIAWQVGGRTAIAADCLATWPVYHAQTTVGTVFSSHRQFWPSLPLRRLEIDVAAAVQAAIFGIVPNSSTIFSGVRILQAAGTLLWPATGAAVVRGPYFDWLGLDTPPARERAGADRAALADRATLADRVYAAFRDAVKVRAERRGAGYCMLSGGLDSRCVAFVLADLGFAPTTVSFGLPDSQDLLIARDVAPLLPGEHLFKAIDFVSFNDAGGTPTIARGMLGPPRSAQPDRIWTGDGSIGLGTWYTEDCIRQAETDVRRCAETLTGYNGYRVSRRVIRHTMPADPAAEAIDQLLSQFHGKRRDLIPFVFYWVYEQAPRQHANHERAIANHAEVLTPFFDFTLLKEILACPAEDMLFHRFYMEFFQRLPAAARSVAWQTYPGHEPCPLPPPHGGRAQWGRVASQARPDRRILQARARQLIVAALTRRFAPLPLRRGPIALIGLASFFMPERMRWHVGQAAAMLATLRLARRSAQGDLDIRTDGHG